MPLHGLDNKEHSFDFVVTDKFFEYFEDKTINGGNINVNLNVSKKIGSIQLTIALNGTVKVLCDRCLEYYDQNIDFKDIVMVEFGEETNFDTNQECVFLEKSKTEINIAQLIYEFAHFALPLQHYHPDKENGDTGCDKKMLDILENYLIVENEKTLDPRWDKLKEFKNKS